MFSSLYVALGCASYGLAAIIDITVGGPSGELMFSPEAISAQPGDQVVYHFNPKNHTVTQSSFASPCGPLAGGYDSGFQPVMSNQTDNKPTFTINVVNTSPIWIYCKQGANTVNSHCGKGMVHAINCGLDGAPNSFTNFKAAALAVGASLNSSTPTTTYTAGYGTATIPPPETPVLTTETVSVGQSTWTTVYSSYPNSPAPTPASLTGNVITVVVGGSDGNLTFVPNRISALPRDTVVFQFQQKNHTVTQSTFSAPCLKLNNATTGQGGFDSGFMPVATNATEFPTWNLTVNDTAPIWAYCRQAGHCGKGMVFAINSDESGARNFAAFQALAEQLNSTTSSSTSSGSSPTTSTGSGVANGVGAGFIVAIAAAWFGLIL